MDGSFEFRNTNAHNSWERKQRADLFQDISRLAASGPDSTHFLATMVGLSRGKKLIATDELQEVEVVDGQRRLTTLIIVLKALAKLLNPSASRAERGLAEEIESLLVKDDKHSLLLLQTNHDSSEYFADYIRTGKFPSAGTAGTLADRLLLQAVQDCEAFVKSWGVSSRLSLGAILKNRLTIIFHEISDELVVYTVFEVLNSRGLDVAWLDRLKSLLMGMAFETSRGDKKEAVQELHRIWAEVYRCVGLHQGRSAEALRFAATLKSKYSLSKVLGQEDAVDSLRALAENSARGAIEVSKWILRVVKAVDSLLSDPRRNAITKIAHARLLAVAIELRDDFGGERARLLKAWEKITFRIFGMCRKDARTRVGDYVRLAHSVISGGVDGRQVLGGIGNLGGDEFSIDEAVRELRDSDRYEGWEEELRYFFYRYEEHLAAEKGQKFSNAQWSRIWEAAPAQSIEHIYPQSAGSLTRTKSARDVFVHRLGNLVLLPPSLNSRLGSKKPAEKAQEYGKTGLLIAIDVVPSLKNWSGPAVRAREEKLLEWARAEWGDQT